MSAGAKRGAAEAGVGGPASVKRARSEGRSSVLKTFLGDKLCCDEFMKDKFGREIVNVKNGAGFFKEEFATTSLDRVLELVEKFGAEAMDWGYTMEAVKTDDGKKVKLSPREGPIKKEDVEKFYNEEKGTLQFHQPQHFCHNLARFMSLLEDLFNGCVGANVYLTPPNAQGLSNGGTPAPHYDTVDVFVCQVSGKKTWKLHEGVSKHPLDDSGDLDTSEAKIGKLIKEVTLEEGDFLYLPRGTVHYATTSSEASAHVTFSTNFEHYQGKFLELALSNAITKAVETDPAFRESLPSTLFEAFGAHPLGKQLDGKGAKTRTEWRGKLGDKLTSLIEVLTKKQKDGESLLMRGADEAADSMCLNFLSERLPPAEQISEKAVLKNLDSKGATAMEEDIPELELTDAKMLELTPGAYLRVLRPDADSLPTLEDSLVSLGGALGSDDEDEEGDGGGEEKEAAKRKKRAEALQNVVAEAEMAIEAAREETMNSLWIADNITNPVVGHMFETGDDTSSPLEFHKDLKPVAMAMLNSAGPISVGDLMKTCPKANSKEDVTGFLSLLVAKRVVRVAGGTAAVSG